MVEGKQEIRVNFEVRELIVAGIVCPEGDNTIDSSKIAQARIAYGGRGQITEMHQKRRTNLQRATAVLVGRVSFVPPAPFRTARASPVGGRDRIEADKTVSVVPINAFATLVPLLRFNRQRRDRARFQAP